MISFGKDRRSTHLSGGPTLPAATRAWLNRVVDHVVTCTEELRQLDVYHVEAGRVECGEISMLIGFIAEAAGHEVRIIEGECAIVGTKYGLPGADHEHVWLEIDGAGYDPKAYWGLRLGSRVEGRYCRYRRGSPQALDRYVGGSWASRALRAFAQQVLVAVPPPRKHLAALDGTLVPIYAYNGGHKWRPGPVELRPAKKGKAHYGPGLYLTTSLKTAAEYAKGGGVISRFMLAPLTFDTDIDMGVEEALDFVKSVPGLHERRELLDVLRRYTSDRRGITLGQVMNIVLSTPSNGVGKVGVALAKAAMSKGADASLVTRAASEDWFTLWNMDKVLKREVVKTGQPGVEWDLPTIMDLRRAGVATPPWEPIPGVELDDSDLPKIHAKLPDGGKS